MKWSWRVGQIAGIGVHIHATFFLLVGWVALSHWTREQTAGAAISGVLFILALFACVVAHELGHALAARRYGIATRDITLLPIGGVARLERMPEKPSQELWVALAGPLVSVVLSLAFFVGLAVRASIVPLAGLDLMQGSFAERLMVTNLFIALFNLIPAFPMDGGRVLRALLATRYEYTRATNLAATIGQGLAFVFGFLGLFGNPLLLFIAFFVWIGAAQESSLVQMKSALGGIPVAHATITNYHALSPYDTLEYVAGLVLGGFQQDFPVVEGGQPVGLLTRQDLVKALAEEGRDRRVGDVMRRDFQVVDAGEMLETAFQTLQQCECRILPVMYQGRLVGLLTPDNLGEFLMIQSAMSGPSRQA
ncbi:MAG TPA: site-2 protease family protein [Armatimonadota bacterium]|jgi:Zn-dependent protease|nr:site-2 protease family protein [Armatimonadota bacterium]HOQ28019.1 site-2 protease family protein [Armatimonadota bacterium]HPO74618.1 site-2 protease family protein [Armatimonadota bacterium]HPT99251.1 site-2 protease family protein [Armatimonadota bacterium]